MKTIVGIFAHPDDESMGPGGTIAKLAKENNFYIICVTQGDAGDTSKIKNEKLGKVRRRELLASAKILGIKKVFFLKFHDGQLCNNLYPKIVAKITPILQQLQPEMLVTFEKHGASGHIDHITVAMITSFLFPKLSFIKEVWYWCTQKNFSDAMKRDFFIHFPDGFTVSQVDKVIDVSGVWETKIKAMKQHESQSADVNHVVPLLEKDPKEELFFVWKK